MVMHSRHCGLFDPYQAKTLPPHHHHERNINFSVVIWQPFLDSKNVEGSNQTLVCGPMISLLVQIAGSMNASLTYLPDENENEVKQGLVQILLCPVDANILTEKIQLYKLSPQLGECPMVSILSAQHPLSERISLHTFASVINLHIVGLYLACWALINLLSYAFSRHEYLHHRFGLNLIRIVLRQPAIGQWFNSRAKLCLLALNLLVLTFFFNQVISNSLLNLFTIKQKWDQINTIEDLVRRPHVNICTFKGAVSTELLHNLSQEPFYQNFKKQIFIPNRSVLGVDNYHQWEMWAINEVSRDRMALIADKPYLDFMWTNYRKKFSNFNLHRSITEQNILPYFLAFRWTSAREPRLLELTINSIVTKIFESGIFNFWVKETIFMNKRGSWEQTSSIDGSSSEETEETEPSQSEPSKHQHDFYYWHLSRDGNAPQSQFRQRIYESFGPLSYDDFLLAFKLYFWLSWIALLVLALEMLHFQFWYLIFCSKPQPNWIVTRSIEVKAITTTTTTTTRVVRLFGSNDNQVTRFHTVCRMHRLCPSFANRTTGQSQRSAIGRHAAALSVAARQTFMTKPSDC